MERALDAVRSGSPAIHTSTPGAARTYALTTVAMYDAVNGIESAARASSRRPAIIGSYAAAPASSDPRAAASAAAHGVLSSLFARNVAVKDVLDPAHEVELADLGPVAGVESGRAWGASVGNQVLQRCSGPDERVPQEEPFSERRCPSERRTGAVSVRVGRRSVP